ncbi:hypothetical protein [Flavobacterium sp.]|uniref:DUF6973 domain-containing protein n=1 Tax=Flavobacterium sp. TaxID=239 RepID=UPI00263203A0|nr:hypothetical protein [Flavobacterium sp.]
MIDTTKIEKVEIEGSYLSYTFYIKQPQAIPSVIKNIIVSQNKDEEVKVYLANYTISNTDLINALTGKTFSIDNSQLRLLSSEEPSGVVYVGSDGTCYGYRRIEVAPRQYKVMIVAIDCPEGEADGNSGSSGGGGSTGSSGGGGYTGGWGGNWGGSTPPVGTNPGNGGGGYTPVTGVGNNGTQQSPNLFPAVINPDSNDCLTIRPVSQTLSPTSNCNDYLITNPLILIRLIDIFVTELDPTERNIWNELEGNPLKNKIINLLESNNYQPATKAFIRQVLNVINAVPIENFDELNYPGKNEGWPYEWWLNNLEIIDRLPIQPDNQTLEPTPNIYELLAFSVYPSQAVIHKFNADTSLAYARYLQNINFDYWKVHNGHADAVRHALWNALGANRFQKEVMQLFAAAHEMPINSGLEFLMDSHNNERGQDIGDAYPAWTDTDDMKTIIISEHNDGTLKYLTPLQENGGLLPNSTLKWTNQ